MFFCRNKLDDKLDTEIEKTRRELDRLLAENANLKKQVRDYEVRMDGEYSKASHSVDWKEMNAFSIERMLEGDRPKTVIGYFINEPVMSDGGEVVVNRNVIHEWTLYCSHEEHQRLVKQFDQYKKEKYGN